MLQRTALVLLALATAAGAQVPTLTSTFDVDAEGWDVVHYEYLNPSLPTVGPAATHDPTFGQAVGSLRVTDQMYYTGVGAPAAYLGDKRAWYGGSISFDLYFRYMSKGDHPACTLVGSAGMIGLSVADVPKDQWHHFTYDLKAGPWRWGSVIGPVATEQQILAVLADLQALVIPTEWASGPDDTSLDNVVLAPAAGGSVAVYGSGLNPSGSIAVVAGSPKLGTTLKLGLTNPIGSMSPGSPTFLAISQQPTPAFPAGLPLPGFGMTSAGSTGELLIDITTSSLALPILAGPAFHGTGQYVSYALPIPADPAFAGLTVYAQGLLLDPLPSPWMGLTDAAMVTLGA